MIDEVMAHRYALIERMMMNAVSAGVSRKLNELYRDSGQYMKDMNSEDVARSKGMMLEMIRKGAEQFHEKMSARLDRNDDKSE